MIITLIVVLPIYSYFYYKYFHTPFRFGLSEKREGTHCPHHSEEQIVTQCKSCNIPICIRCQAFKIEMKKQYDHSLRLNKKVFDEVTCLDCIFKDLEITSKFLYIASPVCLSLGLVLILASFYFQGTWWFFLLFFGVILLILGIVSTIGLFFYIPETKRVEKQFRATLQYTT